MKVAAPSGFKAAVTDKGTLRFESDERRALDMWLLSLAGKTVLVEIEEEKATRSAKANAFYWSVVLKRMELHGETGYSQDELHDLMCDRFLTKKRFVVTNHTTGEMEEREIAGRSSKLTIGDFYTFVEQVRLFAAEFLQVETPDPDKDYWRKADDAAA